MKFSEQWLRTMVNPALDSQQLDHLLTMAGLEVEQRMPAAPAFSGVVVGLVLSTEPHPNADRLRVCQVDVGAEQPLQIVCGAANVAPGLKVPCARVGAELPGLTIAQAKVRDVASSGMLCAAQELGLAEASDGLLVLSPEAVVGQDIRVALDLDDQIFELKLTPNRADCLSVAGIARDVAALAAENLQEPDCSPVPAVSQEQVAVVLEASEDCPLYCGRVIQGINPAAPTPDWMERRLTRSGLRSISALVDITNYVLLELGQPMHAFDLASVQGPVVVRRARAGEQITVLNGTEVMLQADQLVIADQAAPLALAGIMGGMSSAVGDATRDVFLESAFFTPAVIAGKSRVLGFSSDSSYRFERGVDFGRTRAALERATALVLSICGGTPGPVTETRGTLPARPPVRLRVSRAAQVLGIPFDNAQVSGLLRRLQLGFVEEGDVLFVTPPSYRFDLQIEEDLIEELVRVIGYENIPATLPRIGSPMVPEPEQQRGPFRVRRLVAALDYQEVISYAFVEQAWERDFAGQEQPVKLLNPIASQLSVMRSTLIGSLVAALGYNLARKQPRVRLFEMGRVFVPLADGGVSQPQRLAGIAFGPRWPEQWGARSEAVDFYDIKADVEALFHPRPVQCVAATHPALHPGRCARVELDGVIVGWLGELHPRWVQRYDLPAAALVFELDWDALQAQPERRYADISRFQPVRRDLAVLVDEQVPVQAMLDSMNRVKGPMVQEIAVFDVYAGERIAAGKKSLAFRVVMQDTQKTLTDQEVATEVSQFIDILEKEHQAQLR